MSWSFSYTGTPSGVKAKLAADAAAYPSCYPDRLIKFISESIDDLANEQSKGGYAAPANGVSVSSHGHGGSVTKLEIQNATLLLDPPPPQP